MSKNQALLAAVLLAASMTPACGGYLAPTDQLVAAEAATRSAREVGAESTPQAALHLKLAKEALDQAKQLINDKNENANYVLIRAKADAELAIALAKEADAKAQAKKTADQLAGQN
jgi:hypothetical protein